MKTIKRLMARATATACLTAVLLAPTTTAQFSNPESHQPAFDQARMALSESSPLSSLVLTPATADIAETALNDRAQAPAMSRLDWQNYGQRLTDALSGEHAGLRHSALRLIIAYSDQLDLGNEAVVDLMKIYRDDDSEHARRMAVVAMAELDSELAVDYLERSQAFEKSETVKRTIAAVVSAHRAI